MHPRTASKRTPPRSAASRARLMGAAGLALLCGVAALSALSGVHSQAYLPETLGDGMDAAFFLTKFKAAAEQVGYGPALEAADCVGTYFAPVDQGFDALLSASNATWDQLMAANETLAKVVKFHVVPLAKYFPISGLRQGQALPTALEGYSLYVSRDTPGVTHIYAVEKPEQDPMNFATVLQYQEIKGGKCILYVLDRVLIPPAKPNAPASTSTKKRKMLL